MKAEDHMEDAEHYLLGPSPLRARYNSKRFTVISTPPHDFPLLRDYIDLFEREILRSLMLPMMPDDEQKQIAALERLFKLE